MKICNVRAAAICEIIMARIYLHYYRYALIAIITFILILIPRDVLVSR